MTTFNVEELIAAPPGVVWDVLADIGSIADWNPGLEASRQTTAGTCGVGARRHCDLGRMGSLDEEVVEWEPRRLITFRVTESSLPFETARIRFTVRPEAAGTRVTVSPDYRLRHGLLGALLDWLVVRSMYRRGMVTLLGGLKRQAEGHWSEDP